MVFPWKRNDLIAYLNESHGCCGYLCKPFIKVVNESNICLSLNSVTAWDWEWLQRHCHHKTQVKIYLETSGWKSLLAFFLYQCLIYFSYLWILITLWSLTIFGDEISSYFFSVSYPGFCTLTCCCCCTGLLCLHLLEIRWWLGSLILYLAFEFQSSNWHCNFYGSQITNQEW